MKDWKQELVVEYCIMEYLKHSEYLYLQSLHSMQRKEEATQYLHRNYHYKFLSKYSDCFIDSLTELNLLLFSAINNPTSCFYNFLSCLLANIFLSIVAVIIEAGSH